MNNKFKIIFISLIVFFILGNTEASRAEEGIGNRAEEGPTKTEKQPEKDFTWIGKVNGEVLWAKYFSAEHHFNWNGQIGANIDLLRYKRSFLYIRGNLESVLESDGGTDFDPYNMNYMVEPGARLEYSLGSLSFIWHHVCQHDVDRFDGTTEKFNIGGLRLESKKKNIFKNEKGFEWLWNFNELFSLGKYAYRTDNNYDWDVITEVIADILRYKKMVPYLKVSSHLVTQTAKRPSRKKHFVDYAIEPGLKIRIPQGTFNLFCQINHRHDIDRCNGQTDDFGLAGLRYEW